MLIEQSLVDAEFAMERMRSAIERLAIPSAGGGPLTISVGVAQIDPASDHTAELWIARADAALYEAKSRGRNRVMSTRPPKM